MGQYFKIVNVTKKQFIDIAELGENNKLSYVGQGLNGIALGRLLTSHGESDDLWGQWFGNPNTDKFFIGAWAGDRIIVAGDMDGPDTNGVKTSSNVDPGQNLYTKVDTDPEYEDVTVDVFEWLAKDEKLTEMIALHRERK